MNHTTYKFIPYFPQYSFKERFQRYLAISRTFVGAGKIILISKLKKQNASIGASLEITDRCNAGCSYCYVYPKEWDQKERVKGYLGLNHNEKENIDQTLRSSIDRLSNEGKVLVTLVGGEPTLATDMIHYASSKFPVVWVVTNGAKPFPDTPSSVVYSVSIDGPPHIHNASRDPMGFFDSYRYASLTGMSAAIVRNINNSRSGSYVHITLTKNSISTLSDTVHWLCRDVKKLRGIMISGAATTGLHDPLTISVEDRSIIKETIEKLASQYGWRLFPFNQPRVNSYLFEKDNIIHSPKQCSVARRVESLDYSGKTTGKCILRDEIDCETCVCNLTGLMKAVAKCDLRTVRGLIETCFG